MKGRYLTVSVKSHIQRYIIESIGSSIVKPGRDSALMAIIKPHLVLGSAIDEEEPLPEGYAEIQIELPDLRQVYEAKSGKVYYCDTMFRDHIDRLGLERVRHFFNQTFKAAFRTFMDGYTEYQQENKAEDESIKVKKGVCAFFNQYHITYDDTMVSSLTRDWYRHQERNEKNRFTPVLY